MFKILQKTLATGIVTTNYPGEPPQLSHRFRGRPSFDFANWKDARPAADVCPTGAISLRDKKDSRQVTVDYGLCIFCGLCAEASADQAVRITQEFELASTHRRNLVVTAEYSLNIDSTHRELRAVHRGAGNVEANIEQLGQKASEKIQKLLRRSLAIREVDAGSCKGCERGWRLRHKRRHFWQELCLRGRH
jgi:formate hydrogenlyase subunit 6/NADH:ubiquinone oxidoreductase subunit I